MRTVLNYLTKVISVSAHTLSSEFLLRPGMEGVSYSWLGGIALLHVGVFFALAQTLKPLSLWAKFLQFILPVERDGPTSN